MKKGGKKGYAGPEGERTTTKKVKIYRGESTVCQDMFEIHVGKKRSGEPSRDKGQEGRGRPGGGGRALQVGWGGVKKKRKPTNTRGRNKWQNTRIDRRV